MSQALFIRVTCTNSKMTSFTFPNGRTINCAVGATIDIEDFLAQQLPAENWIQLGFVGTTANRPNDWSRTIPFRTMEFLDTTLNKFIVYDGNGIWRDSQTGAAV